MRSCLADIVPLRVLVRSACTCRYKARIPTVLVQMREYLIKNGGLDVVGIFRLAPDADESTFVKQQLVS